jgi:phosphoribosylanthranilate isomerase
VPTRIKICGITRAEDAAAACAAGADALGFVFHPDSPRRIDAAAAAAIAARMPPFVATVGVFVDPDTAYVRRILDAVPLDLLQFHGDETPALCASFARPYLKAVRMRPEVDLLEYTRLFGNARALLLDTYVRGGAHGGTGLTFDWRLVPRNLPLPIVLSGGLDARNVTEAVRTLRPWAVDVSSGVEAAKGVKDPQRIRELIAGVRDADA